MNSLKTIFIAQDAMKQKGYHTFYNPNKSKLLHRGAMNSRTSKSG